MTTTQHFAGSSARSKGTLSLSFCGLLTFLFFCATPLFAQRTVTIAVDAAQEGVAISPMLYGIFYEDINHAADGGIYAELLRNRSFEDDDTTIVAWQPVLPAGGTLSLALATEGLLNSAQQHCLHVVAQSDGPAGVANSGYWGINVEKDSVYTLSLFIKVVTGDTFCAALTSADGLTTYAKEELAVDASCRDWQKVSCTLKPKKSDTAARFTLTSAGSSDYFLDVVSLFPPTYNNRPNGLRRDLVQMLADLHPTFMRFPGGCFVEGRDTPDNAFRWQRTVGPIEERPGHDNTNWGYRTSDGLGYYEYLQLAEDIGAKPLYVCNIGIWHGGVTPLDSLQEWIDEALAAIEYANGDVSTPYGALRAKHGHPAPFNLEYIEIGNENNQEDRAQTSDHYYQRYERFREAILDKYPDMHIIANVAAWGTDDPRWNSTLPATLVDEHYYRSPAWFANNFKKYDSYDRSWPQVYCGEYAVTIAFGEIGNLNAALGEAVFMMGFENNSDIVAMSSYAPIFVNDHDNKWMPDMVRFDNNRVMGTPSYYVQQLFAQHRGEHTVVLKEGQETLFPSTGDYTPDEKKVGVGTWRTKATYKDMVVHLADGTSYAVDLADTATFCALDTTWDITKEGLQQHNRRVSSQAVLKVPVLGKKYSLTLKARKDEGSEGFVIVFNYVDKKTYCWLTLGSQNNSSHVIEQAMSGGRQQLKRVKGHIKDKHWYDIRLDVDGNNVVAYLDGKVVLRDTLLGATLPGVFASAATGKQGQEMIVKIVNTSDEEVAATLDLGAFATHGGTITQLVSSSGNDENTLDNPTAVAPQTTPLSLSSTAPTVVIPPFSLNILHLAKD